MKPPKSTLLPFSRNPAPRRPGARPSAQQSGNGNGNRWTRQSASESNRVQARGQRGSNGRSDAAGSGASDDLDLVSALNARAAGAVDRNGGSLASPHPMAATAPSRVNSGGSWSGGRIRMDAPKAVRTGPRIRAVPGAPRYRSNAKPVNWRAIFLITLVALVAAYSLTYVFTSPALDAQAVEFRGVSPATAALLQSDMPGQPIGSNVIRYVLEYRRAVKKTVGGAEADFASASLGIRFPHTLVVTVARRAPCALLTIGGQAWALDRRGVPVQAADDPELDATGLPRLEIAPTGSGEVLPTAGRRVPQPLSGRIEEGYSVLSALSKQHGFSPVQAVRIDSLGNITLALATGLRIKLGQASELNSKLALANTLMQQQPQIAADANYLDVTYPARPAFLPKGAAQTLPAPLSATPATDTAATDTAW